MHTIKKALRGAQKTFLRLWRDESGQGATEYILILAVLGTLIMVFKDPLIKLVTSRTGEVGDRLKSTIEKL